MIDLDSEVLMDLPAACGHPALRNSRTGRACHVAQLYRYIHRGARAANGQRVRLETIRTPGGLRTSREAIGRFIHALTDPDLPPPAPRTRTRQIDSAERELQSAGYIVGGGEV